MNFHYYFYVALKNNNIGIRIIIVVGSPFLGLFCAKNIKKMVCIYYIYIYIYIYMCVCVYV